MSKRNQTFFKDESIIFEINNALDSLSNDYQDGKAFIYPGKEGLWDGKYRTLKDGLLRQNKEPADRKERKKMETSRENTLVSLLLFHRSVEVMRLLHEGDTNKIKEMIESLKWHSNSKQRFIRQLLRLSQKGPAFFRAINGDNLDESDRFFLEETLNVNSLLDKGMSYKEAIEKVAKVKDITIVESEKTLFKGTVVVSEDGKTFFGVGEDEYQKKYIDCSIVSDDGRTSIVVCDSETNDKDEYIGIGNSFVRVGSSQVGVTLTSSRDISLNQIKTIKTVYECLKKGKKYQGSRERNRLLKEIHG